MPRKVTYSLGQLSSFLSSQAHSLTLTQFTYFSAWWDFFINCQPTNVIFLGIFFERNGEGKEIWSCGPPETLRKADWLKSLEFPLLLNRRALLVCLREGKKLQRKQQSRMEVSKEGLIPMLFHFLSLICDNLRCCSHESHFWQAPNQATFKFFILAYYLCSMPHTL